MKPAQPINLSGQIYYIDTDAYALLDSYLRAVANAFAAPDQADVVADIESRAAELLTARIATPSNVLNIADVQAVIDIIGAPDQLDDEAYATITPPPFANGQATNPANGPANGPAANPGANPGEPGTPMGACTPAPTKKLYRDLNDKVLGGVIAGIGAYTGWNVPLMRFLFVALCIVFNIYQWPVILYIVAWALIPPARTPKERLEMCGHPITLDTIGQSVRQAQQGLSNMWQQAQGPVKQSYSVLGEIASAVTKVLLALVGIIAFPVGFAAVCGTLVCLVCTFCTAFGMWPIAFDVPQNFGPTGIWAFIAGTCGCLFLVVLCVAAIWLAGAVLFNWRPASRSTIIAAIATGAVLVAITTITGFIADHIYV